MEPQRKIEPQKCDWCKTRAFFNEEKNAKFGKDCPYYKSCYPEGKAKAMNNEETVFNWVKQSPFGFHVRSNRKYELTHYQIRKALEGLLEKGLVRREIKGEFNLKVPCWIWFVEEKA